MYAGILLAGLGVSGCKSVGLSRYSAPRVDYNNFIYDLYKINVSKGENSVVRKPMNIAVAQMGENTPPVEVIAKLRQKRTIFKRVSPLPMPLSRLEPTQPIYSNRDQYRIGQDSSRPDLSNEMKTMMRMARDLGADYIYLMGGTLEIERAPSGWAILNLAILPTFIVPSTDLNLEGKASGALIDAKTGRLCMMTSVKCEDNDFLATASLAEAEAKMKKEHRLGLMLKSVEDLENQLSELGE